ncbi:proteasome assembly chaperone family protein [Halobacterium wangiae]|uniref:proteasome assembly chaperone family protein n=1 Tax=Halobacterium wangiae TaxID=2902623 RepID=UPI001E296358|nr:proteasome assembly chaperone family protein [Halobacterium wangiae]
MARVRVKSELDLDSPTLVEGLPGVGLVGKIATDHLVDTLDMTYVASVDCGSVPQVTIYDEDARDVLPPVRIYANESQDVLALQSDVPISRGGDDFAECITTWLQDNDVTPLYLSGLPVKNHEMGDVPEVFGIATGDAAARLDDLDIGTPPERGIVGGPTGALVNRAGEYDLDAVCLVVESDPRFPDPAAAKHLIQDAIEPLADVDVSTDDLVEHAEEIREQKEQFAQRMQEASEEESTQAQPMRMFQ